MIAKLERPTKLEHRATAEKPAKSACRVALGVSRREAQKRWAYALRLAISLMVLFLAACKKEANHVVEGTGPAIRRGDQVVVERSAARFVEAQVLKVQGDELKVQTVLDRETIAVRRADVYPVGRLRAERPGAHLCRIGRAEWEGCRVERLGEKIVAGFSDGRKQTLERADVLGVSELTRLNIERRFERARSRSEFERELVGAGRPRAPNGWRPRGREPVIALRDGAWISASVHEIEEDGLRVRFRADGAEAKLPWSEVVPEPPHRTAWRHGMFALRRPPSLSESWIGVKVRRVSEDGISVLDVSGTEQVARRRDLVPLFAR